MNPTPADKANRRAARFVVAWTRAFARVALRPEGFAQALPQARRFRPRPVRGASHASFPRRASTAAARTRLDVLRRTSLDDF
jgi:hypothetical protein